LLVFLANPLLPFFFPFYYLSLFLLNPPSFFCERHSALIVGLMCFFASTLPSPHQGFNTLRSRPVEATLLGVLLSDLPWAFPRVCLNPHPQPFSFVFAQTMKCQRTGTIFSPVFSDVFLSQVSTFLMRSFLN